MINVIVFLNIVAENYQNGDWLQLEYDILHYYDADLDDTRYTPDQLVKLVAKWQSVKISELATWKRYQREFFTKAGWLMSQGLINEDMQAGYFWHGIDRKFRKTIETRLLAHVPHYGADKAYPLQLVTQIAEELLERNCFEHDLVGPSLKRSDWYNMPESESELDDDECYDNQNSYKNCESSDKHTVLNKVDQLMTRMSHMAVSDPVYALLYHKAAELDPTIMNIVRTPVAEYQVQQNQPVSVLPVQPPEQPSVYHVEKTQDIPYPHRSLEDKAVAILKPCRGCGLTDHKTRFCAQIMRLIRIGTLTRNGDGKFVYLNGSKIQRNHGETIIQAVQRAQMVLRSYSEGLRADRVLQLSEEHIISDPVLSQSYARITPEPAIISHTIPMETNRADEPAIKDTSTVKAIIPIREELIIPEIGDYLVSPPIDEDPDQLLNGSKPYFVPMENKVPPLVTNIVVNSQPIDSLSPSTLNHIDRHTTSFHQSLLTMERSDRPLEDITSMNSTPSSIRKDIRYSPTPCQENPYKLEMRIVEDSVAGKILEYAKYLADHIRVHMKDILGSIGPSVNHICRVNYETTFYDIYRSWYLPPRCLGMSKATLMDTSPQELHNIGKNYLNNMTDLVLRVVFLMKFAIFDVLPLLFCVPSMVKPSYTCHEVFTIFLRIIEIYFIYKRAKMTIRRIYQLYHHLHPAPRHIPQNDRSGHMAEPSVPPALNSGPIHAVPGHQSYPATDRADDQLASQALTRIAAQIPSWPPAPNGVYPGRSPTFLPRYVSPNFNDARIALHWTNETARHFGNRPINERILSLISSSNSIELASMYLDSVNVNAGVLLNTSFVTHTLRDPSNVAIENGHLYYLFVQHPGLRGFDPLYPRAHYPTASTLGLTQSPPYLRYAIAAPPTEDLDTISIVKEPEIEECTDDEELDENDELQYPDDSLDGSDNEGASTRAQYASSNVSESQDVEPTLDPREPHTDIPYISSIDEQLNNPHIMYYPSPRSPTSPLLALTLIDEACQADNQAVALDEINSKNETDSPCMQYPRSFRTRADELYGSKIILDDDDIARTIASEYEHGMRRAARAPAPHAKHIILRESGVSDNELDMLTYPEILKRIRHIFDTIRPPTIYLEKRITMSELRAMIQSAKREMLITDISDEETDMGHRRIVTMLACPDQTAEEVHALNNKIISEASTPCDVEELL
ncbi:hypothetical protein PLEOSDRAFT_171737 [Pleurotus ostreatus PC15]|uniref:Uncharacterized protein n=1 Tax=Pleurotus ostreatus (strain PC15) TaxID=1137138 RepID=A0A067N2X3_PLEO1|nr:hypothetical protein PLEOSDRAFT_171737 [Pleurotus ostreatus PC15]